METIENKLKILVVARQNCIRKNLIMSQKQHEENIKWLLNSVPSERKFELCNIVMNICK